MSLPTCQRSPGLADSALRLGATLSQQCVPREIPTLDSIEYHPNTVPCRLQARVRRSVGDIALAIFDEAHRTVGPRGGRFAAALSDQQIRIKSAELSGPNRKCSRSAIALQHSEVRSTVSGLQVRKEVPMPSDSHDNCSRRQTTRTGPGSAASSPPPGRSCAAAAPGNV